MSATSMLSSDAKGIDSIMADMPAFGSEFAKTYANHAPMVLVALHSLGAGPERLYDFFESYRDYKELLPFGEPSSHLDADSWQTAIGHREREADLRLFFTAEVDRLGGMEALRTYLPRLAAGVGASAFHALMRTAYALIRGSESEIAISLAYWAATYLAMPLKTGDAPKTKDPAEVLRRVYGLAEMHVLPLHELLWQNMDESGRCAAFAPVVDWLEIDAQSLSRMAETAIALFAATMDFSALHAVTGLHWMRLVLPYCANGDVMQSHFWQCIAALVGEMKFPALPDPAELARWRTLPVPDWPQIKAAAALSYDEHDISLAFSASEEMKMYHDPLYQLAAARRVGLIADYR